jgi:hypothetical protein
VRRWVLTVRARCHSRRGQRGVQSCPQRVSLRTEAASSWPESPSRTAPSATARSGSATPLYSLSTDVPAPGRPLGGRAATRERDLVRSAPARSRRPRTATGWAWLPEPDHPHAPQRSQPGSSSRRTLRYCGKRPTREGMRPVHGLTTAPCGYEGNSFLVRRILKAGIVHRDQEAPKPPCLR